MVPTAVRRPARDPADRGTARSTGDALPEPSGDRRREHGRLRRRAYAGGGALAEIWREVLGLDRVGVHDDFFELGGDSILAIQIVAHARRAGLALSYARCFERPDRRRLAERRADERRSAPCRRPARRQRRGAADADAALVLRRRLADRRPLQPVRPGRVRAARSTPACWSARSPRWPRTTTRCGRGWRAATASGGRDRPGRGAPAAARSSTWPVAPDRGTRVRSARRGGPAGLVADGGPIVAAALFTGAGRRRTGCWSRSTTSPSTPSLEHPPGGPGDAPARRSRRGGPVRLPAEEHVVPALGAPAHRDARSDGVRRRGRPLDRGRPTAAIPADHERGPNTVGVGPRRSTWSCRRTSPTRCYAGCPPRTAPRSTTCCSPRSPAPSPSGPADASALVEVGGARPRAALRRRGRLAHGRLVHHPGPGRARRCRTATGARG